VVSAANPLRYRFQIPNLMEIHVVVQYMEHEDGQAFTTFILRVHFMRRTHDNSGTDEGNFHALRFSTARSNVDSQSAAKVQCR
jgi:hypothetical protein